MAAFSASSPLPTFRLRRFPYRAELLPILRHGLPMSLVWVTIRSKNADGAKENSRACPRHAISGHILVLELEAAAWGEQKRGNGTALRASAPSEPIGRLVHYPLLGRYWHTSGGRVWK